MIKSLYNHFDDSYTTPENVPRFLMSHLPFGVRLPFFYRYVRLIMKYRPYAIRGEYNDERWARSSLEMHRIMERFGARIHLEGLDNLRAVKEPVVLVSNHMSTAESQLLPGIVEPIKHITFVVKKELMEGPIWGPVMKARDPITVGRENPRDDMAIVLKDGLKHLEKGRSVFIFPQNTRSVHFTPDVFNSLGAKLAKKAGVKIQPCALKTDFWGNGRIASPFGHINPEHKIHFAFAPAMDITGNGKEQHEACIKFIMDCHKRWGHNPA